MRASQITFMYIHRYPLLPAGGVIIGVKRVQRSGVNWGGEDILVHS